MNKNIFLLLLFYACFAGAMEPDVPSEIVQTWVNPTQKPIKTIYYQGIFCSQVQAAKYTGNRGFIASSGERVVCSRAIDTIHDLYVGHEIDEVKFAPKENVPFAWSDVWHPINTTVKLYDVCSYAISKRVAEKTYYTTVEPTDHSENADHTVSSHSINLFKMNLGQEGDLNNHRLKVEKCCQDYPDADQIIYGVSRGAATSVSALCLNNYDTSKIRLAIIEGCFDSLSGLISKWKSCKSPAVASFVYGCMQKLPYSHQHDGPCPVKSVAQFPHNVSVLFVTSDKDTLVNQESTRNVVQAVADGGHPNVYYLILKNSRHAFYPMDDVKDAYDYERICHALFKKLDLPHIPALAIAGKDDLEKCKV